MKTVREDDEQDENEDPEEYKIHFKTDKKCESIAAMTASEKLNAACHRMATRTALAKSTANTAMIRKSLLLPEINRWQTKPKPSIRSSSHFKGV